MSVRNLLYLPLLLLVLSCTPQSTIDETAVEQAEEEALPLEELLPTGPVKVALLLPMSGSLASVGQDMVHAAQMALFDATQADIVFLPKDTKGSAAGALAAVESAVSDGAELILGPLLGSSARSIRPVLERENLIALSFSNDRSVASPNVFVMGYRPEEQIERIMKFAQSRVGGPIAFIGPDNLYGSRVRDAWRQAGTGTRLGEAALYPENQSAIAASIRGLTGYDQRRAALEREIERLGQAGDEESERELARLERLDALGNPPFDGLLIADGGSRLSSVAALLAYYEVDPQSVQVLGTMQWLRDPAVLREDSLQGAWLALPSVLQEQQFLNRFEELFGKRTDTLAALAYDAAALAILIGRDDRSYPIEELTDPSGFLGRAGVFRLREDGLTDHALAIGVVSRGRIETVDPAPSEFGVGF